MKISRKIFSVILLLVVLTLLSSATYADTDSSASISVSLVNQDPDPASAGDIVELRLGITNRGGEPANNLIIELEPSYPFELLSGEDAVVEAGTINAYQGLYESDMKVVKFEVLIDKDATAGTYELEVTTYEENTLDTTTRILLIDIENKESAEVIYIDQVELIPGKITPLKFTINNVGSAPLRDLTFHWENEEDIILPVGSDNTKYIKYIEIGESAELTFNVIASASADPDLYKLDLTLSYPSPTLGEETEINTKAGVYVGGATDFDAAFSGNSGSEYSFSIANIGSVAATSVTVHIPEQDGWQVSGSDSVIIGNLNKGDYTIASFNLQSTMTRDSTRTTGEQTPSGTRVPQTSSEKPLTIEITYTDSRGNRETVTKEVTLSASAAGMTNADGTAMTKEELMSSRGGTQQQSTLKTFWTNSKWLIIIVVIIVVTFSLRGKYKREKITNSHYTVKQMLGLQKGRKRR